MDVLRPPLMWVGDRCYRKTFSETNSNRNYAEEEDNATEACDMYMDETCEIGMNIEETDKGYRMFVACPSVCFGLIIGKRGETKKKIETETKTQIRIPRQGQKGSIEMLGKDRGGIASAHTRINLLIETARRRQPFTHFISIPMVSSEIQDKFDEFKEDILRFCGEEKGIDATIFQNNLKLHMTVGTLTLLDDDEVERASDVLKDSCNDLISSILQGCPLLANVRGLEYMNDDPNAVDVLYAKVSLQDGSERLQDLANSLVDRFVAVGLMERQYDRVKLHITVMNTLFRKDSNASAIQNPPPAKASLKERECFDATKVLKLHGDYNFGQIHISELHLSQRLSTSTDGYYAPASSIPLP